MTEPMPDTVLTLYDVLAVEDLGDDYYSVYCRADDGLAEWCCTTSAAELRDAAAAGVELLTVGTGLPLELP